MFKHLTNCQNVFQNDCKSSNVSTSLSTVTIIHLFFLFFVFWVFFNLLKFSHFWETERDREQAGVGQRERETEFEAGSRLWAVSTEPHAGLEPMNHEIVTWVKVRCLTDGATQEPLYCIFTGLGDRLGFLSHFCCLPAPWHWTNHLTSLGYWFYQLQNEVASRKGLHKCCQQILSFFPCCIVC